MQWDIVAGCATGAAHLKSGTSCQDAFHHDRSSHWVVATVCDGAGSSRHGGIGARLAADNIVKELVLLLDTAPQALHGDCNYWRNGVTASIASTRSLLKNRIGKNSEGLSEYHATIVGVVAGLNYGFFFHIGDGAGLALDIDSWEATVVSPPQNGEYADQTYFYTMDNWEDYLRLTFFDGAPDLITLMSDGAMSFVASKGLGGLDPNFMGPVMRYLDTVDEKTGSNALLNTLESPQTHTITGDDKTLLIATRRP